MAAALTGCALEPTADSADDENQAVVPVVPRVDASRCPDGAVCLYQNPDRGGMMIVLSAGASISDFTTIRCPGCIGGTIGNDRTFDHQMSSWENRSAFPNCFYDKPLFGGPPHVMPPHELHNAKAGDNDTASSIEPCVVSGMP
jgi:hypothetical protein